MKYVITAGYLIDGIQNIVQHNKYIYVVHNRIIDISTNKRPDHHNFNSINAETQCVIPGIIDSHKHFFNNGGSQVGYGISLMQLVRNIKANINGGVTSVLDLGAPLIIKHLHMLPLKNKPRIFYAGPILTCSKGYPIEYMKKTFYKLKSVIECPTKQSITKNVQYVLKNGGSVIKTAVVGRTFDGRNQIRWETDMLKHLVKEAHRHHLKVCAHITYANDYKLAIDAGVDSFHHASFDPMFDDDIQRMAESDSIFVPTLSALELMISGLKERIVDRDHFNPPVSKKIFKHLKAFTDNFYHSQDDKPIKNLFIAMSKKELLDSQGTQMENLKKYLAYGGEVAVGTDAALGFSFHGCPTREMELLNEAGLTIPDTIRAATYNSAKVFGMEAQLGSIETGKLADMLIVDKRILDNICWIDKPISIINNGKLIK